jgi:hypothetical protein
MWAMVDSFILLEGFDLGHGWQFIFTQKFLCGPWLAVYFYPKVLTWPIAGSLLFCAWAMADILFLLESFDMGHG